MLRSNNLDVLVRPSWDDENVQDVRRLLMSPASARLLYHRLIRPEEGRLPNHYRRLAALADRSDQELLSLGAVQYALGRALMEASREQGSIRLRKRASDWLKRAHDSKTLGRNQRKKALQLSADL
jgi:hypothetical protein